MLSAPEHRLLIGSIHRWIEADDLFDYFRGWLILEGQTAFEYAVQDPDSLPDLTAVGHAAVVGMELEGEIALSIASRAFTRATGQESSHSYTITYQDPESGWDFEFGDRSEMHRRLPRLAQLYQY